MRQSHYIAALAVLLSAISECRAQPVPLPRSGSAQSRPFDDQRRIFARLNVQLGAGSSHFAAIKLMILRVMVSEDRLDVFGGRRSEGPVQPATSGGYLDPPWGVTSSPPEETPFMQDLGNVLQNSRATDVEITAAREAYEKELDAAETEFVASQRDLYQAATLRERGWLLVDGLIAGSPSTGPGEAIPQRGWAPSRLEHFLEQLQADMQCSNDKWQLLRPKIIKIIDNQLGPVGGLPVLFPEIYHRATARPTTMPSSIQSRFQAAVSDLQVTMGNSKSSDAEISNKIDIVLKEKKDSDATYATAQHDLRLAGISPHAEAVLVIEGLLSAHHR